jgi:hypothetical protein
MSVRRKALFAGLCMIVFGAAAGWYFLIRSEWAQIDMCLDGGGRWDYDAGLCDKGKQ